MLWTRLLIRLALAFSILSIAVAHVPLSHKLMTVRVSDTSSVDGIVRSLYIAVSGPKGEKHDWSLLRSIFVPGARMGEVWRSSSGESHYEAHTVEQYIANTDKSMTETGYFERERHRRTDVFGSIAQVFSSYESRSMPGEAKPEFRGINLIQLENDGKRWWITSIQWQSEDKQLKLPQHW